MTTGEQLVHDYTDHELPCEFASAIDAALAAVGHEPEMLAEIDRLRARVAELEREVEELKARFPCETCGGIGSVLSDGARAEMASGNGYSPADDDWSPCPECSKSVLVVERGQREA